MIKRFENDLQNFHSGMKLVNIRFTQALNDNTNIAIEVQHYNDFEARNSQKQLLDITEINKYPMDR